MKTRETQANTENHNLPRVDAAGATKQQNLMTNCWRLSVDYYESQELLETQPYGAPSHFWECPSPPGAPSSSHDENWKNFILCFQQGGWKSSQLEIHPELYLLHLPLRSATLSQPDSRGRKEIPTSSTLALPVSPTQGKRKAEKHVEGGSQGAHAY